MVIAALACVGPFANTARAVRSVIWIDDAIPQNVNLKGSGAWTWVDRKKGPVLQGKKSMVHTAKGLSQHFFYGAKTPLNVAKGDTLFVYVYLDRKNPPKEIMLQWNDGNWEHRAYWGQNLIPWGKNGTSSRRHMGKLPPVGRWVRLPVPAEYVGIKPGGKINGWAFTQFDGTVYWDKAGIITRAKQLIGTKRRPPSTKTSTRQFNRSATH